MEKIRGVIVEEGKRIVDEAMRRMLRCGRRQIRLGSNNLVEVGFSL